MLRGQCAQPREPGAIVGPTVQLDRQPAAAVDPDKTVYIMYTSVLVREGPSELQGAPPTGVLVDQLRN